MNAPVATPPITFTIEQVREWIEWFDLQEGEFLRMFRAIEKLAEVGNGCLRRAYHPQDELDTRYDEIEEPRNEALQMLSWISSAESTIRAAMQEKVISARSEPQNAEAAE